MRAHNCKDGVFLDLFAGLAARWDGLDRRE